MKEGRGEQEMTGDKDRIQLNRVKALLASIEQEGKTDFSSTDSQTGYLYINGFRDGVAWSIERIRQKIAGAMFDF
jgi:hypothetical protein